MADGKTIAKEMRYLAETEDIERDGPQEDADDWDSLSDRVRKARRQQKSLLQQHRGKCIANESFSNQFTQKIAHELCVFRSVFRA